MAIRFGTEFFARFWFLPCLFFAELIYYVIIKYFKKYAIQTIFGFVLLGVFYNHIYARPLPYSLDMSFISIGFLAFGNYLMKEKAFPCFSIIINCFLFVLYMLFTYANYCHMGAHRVDMYETVLGNYFYFFVASFVGSVFIISVSTRIKQVKAFSFIGRNSLSIYGLHFVAASFVSLIIKGFSYSLNISLDPCMLAFLKTLLVVLLMFPICRFINKYMPFIIGKI